MGLCDIDVITHSLNHLKKPQTIRPHIYTRSTKTINKTNAINNCSWHVTLYLFGTDSLFKCWWWTTVLRYHYPGTRFAMANSYFMIYSFNFRGSLDQRLFSLIYKSDCQLSVLSLPNRTGTCHVIFLHHSLDIN